MKDKKKSSSLFTDLVDRERLINNFFDILRIKSPSREERAVSDYLIKKFDDLGIKLQEDNVGKKIGGSSGNLTGKLINNFKIDGSARSIFLMAHLDTVSINGEISPALVNGKIVNQNKDCILGGDDKVAVTAILEALSIIADHRLRTRDLYLIFTVAEEAAVLGARYIDLSKVKAKYGFVFDGDGDVGTIFNQAPFHNTFSINIKGKAAHAGAEPEKGISSIKAAADAISRLNPGRVDRDTTYNIGIINGGVATNIVPEETNVKAEARSLYEKKLESLTSNIKDIFIKSVTDYGARIKIKTEREYDGFLIEKNEFPMRIASKALLNMGIRPRIVSTGGGSDINILNSRGKCAVNLSSGMEKIHTSKEYVKFEQLVNLVVLILELCTVKI